MSFSSDVKKEIGTRNNLNKKEEIKFELIGYLMTSNCEVKGKKIKYTTESDYNINRFSKILSNLNINHEIQMSGNFFVVKSEIPEIDYIEVNENNIDIKDEDKELYEASEQIKRALIRGMLLGSGHVSDPNKDYQLIITFSSEKNLSYAAALVRAYDIKLRRFKTRERAFIHMRKAEEISKVLALVGANKAVMEYENIRIERDMRGKINRLVNCETANLNKTINAAVEQIEAINKLKKEDKFEQFADDIKQIAEIRLKFPEMPLSEIGKLMVPEMSRTAVNHRLQKIIKVSKGIYCPPYIMDGKAEDKK